MTFDEAVKECRNGHFLTHKNFDSGQSMHECGGQLYYEDGACLSNQMSFLRNEKSLQTGWSIKFDKEKVDRDKLKQMHKDAGRLMLRKGTYEDCIIS